jgi:hypothetical protein
MPLSVAACGLPMCVRTLPLTIVPVHQCNPLFVTSYYTNSHFVASPLFFDKGNILNIKKPLILFMCSSGLDIHGIGVCSTPTGDAGVPSGGECGNDNGDEQGSGCGKIVLVGSVSGVSRWLPSGFLLL